MPVAHRNVLAAMLVGCLSVVMGWSPSARGDSVTVCFAISDDHVDPQVTTDTMFVYMEKGCTAAGAPTNVSTSLRLNWNQSYPFSAVPQGIKVTDPESMKIYLCFDPVGSGPSHQGYPLDPGSCNDNSGVRPDAGAKHRIQLCELTKTGAPGPSQTTGAVDISFIDFYGFPVGVTVDGQAKVAYHNVDQELRKVIEPFAAKYYGNMPPNGLPDIYPPAPPSPGPCKSSRSDDYWRSMSPGKISATANNPFFNTVFRFSKLAGNDPFATISTHIDNLGSPTNQQFCNVWNDNGVEYHFASATVEVADNLVTITLSENHNGTGDKVVFSGSPADMTSAILRSNLDQNPHISRTGTTVSAAELSYIGYDLAAGFTLGYIGCTTTVKRLMATPDCETPEPILGIAGQYGPAVEIGSLNSIEWWWLAESTRKIQPTSIDPDTGGMFYSLWTDHVIYDVSSNVYSFPNAEAMRSAGVQPPFTKQDSTMTLTVESLYATSVTCDGDLDDSFHTDIGDVLLMVQGWGTPDSDVTGDGLSDILDLLVVLRDYGCDHR